MKRGYLSDYFVSIGTKILTRVDATSNSNQHEVGDKRRGQVLMQILGDTPRTGDNRFDARYIWLRDEQESITEGGFLSWYDTRETDETRPPEWRLYYQTNAVTELMDEGDRLFVARQPDDTVLFIVVPDESVIVSRLSWLFGIGDPLLVDEFTVLEITPEDDTKLDFVARFILDEVGIEFEDPNANSLDSIIERFGMEFPTTAEFSDLARLTLPEVDAQDDPDTALLAWLNQEEAMFRRLENRIVAHRVAQGFSDANGVNVDAFIKYSLGVQNRRKSRMGYSFQNHLRAVFDAFELRYNEQVITEKGKRPDFIFPGEKEYNNSAFNVSLLTMLAAKSSCKDRWPQILPEAERISQKHLVTLELGISVPQTDMMQESNVQLVVPGNIRSGYKKKQQEWIWSLGNFLDLVIQRQSSS